MNEAMRTQPIARPEHQPSAENVPPPPCPKCGTPMAAAMVRTMFWRDDRPAIVENIPAMTCGSCLENFYDEVVSDALRRLAEQGFPASEADASVVVPVFSLRVPLTPHPPLPDDCYLD